MFNCRGVVVALLFFTFGTHSLGAKARTAAPWQVGTAYHRGSLVTHEGATYRCLYPHTAMKTWEPNRMAALWQPLTGSAARPAAAEQRPRPPITSGRVFAPYTHVTESNNDLAAIRSSSGIRSFILAFIVSDGGCAPAWQGRAPLPITAQNALSSRINSIHGRSGNIIISFGGYVGADLAQVCPDVTSLQSAYQAVLDKYQVTNLDFDVESSAIKDPDSIERRNQALKALAAANPGLVISFTLPAMPAGIPEPALAVLRNAVKVGTPIALINIMAMDYGEPIPDGNMGPAAISAAGNALDQLQQIGVNAGLGITPMIGMNDSAGEIFTPADARMLLEYARRTKRVVLLSMWSVGRDNGTCRDTISPSCSGIQQRPWEFSRIFASF